MGCVFSYDFHRREVVQTMKKKNVKGGAQKIRNDKTLWWVVGLQAKTEKRKGIKVLNKSRKIKNSKWLMSRIKFVRHI